MHPNSAQSRELIRAGLVLLLLLHGPAPAESDADGWDWLALDAGTAPVSEDAAAGVVELPDEPAAAVPAPADGARYPVEEIVVTARKREESVQDIPLSVTPFTAEDLERRGFTRMEDIAAATPGFVFDGSITSGHHSNAVIRGLAPQFTIARVQNVSFFLNGVYLPRQSMLNLGLIDMERIEVVKGPQNAVFGRNAFAGAVNYITRRPGEEVSGAVSATLGLHERQDLRFNLSGPLSRDGRWRGSLGYGLANYDGHTDNDHPMRNANPAGPNTRGRLGGYEDWALNLGLGFESGERLRFDLGYYRSEVLRETQPGYMISGLGAARFGLRTEDENDLNCNPSTQPDISEQRTVSGYTLYCGELPDAASDITYRTVPGIVIDPRGLGAQGNTHFFTGSADWEWSDDLSWHLLLGYARHASQTTGGPGGEDPILGQAIATNIPVSVLPQPAGEAGITRINSFSGRPNLELTTWSGELRMDWQVSERSFTSWGLYASKVEDTDWVLLFLNSLCNDANEANRAHCNQPLTAPSPIASESVATAPVAYDQGIRQHAHARGEWTEFEDDILALFAAYSFDLTATLSTTLEGRYTIEKKRVHRITDSFGIRDGDSYSYNPGTHPVLFPGTLEDQVLKPRDGRTDRYFTPRLTLDWAYHDERMLFFSAAKGLKTGGFNNAEDPAQLAYAESENWSYELGSKNRLLDGRLTLNAALFFIDWRAIQGEIPPTNGGLSSSDLITNLGDATSSGIEIESSWQAAPWLSLDLGLTYNDARYRDGVIFTPATNRIDCDGDTCPSDGHVGGKEVPRTSKEQASLGLNLNLPLPGGWLSTTRWDLNYQSRQYVTQLNVTTLPERMISNLSMNLLAPGGQWEFNLWGKNIFDEEYPAYAFYIGIFNQYLVSKGAGPSWGGTLKYHFF